jgi:hypothetical protein
MRSGIRAGILACPGLSTLPVIDAIDVRHVETLAREHFPGQSAVIIWDGMRNEGAPALGGRAPEDQRHRWVIVLSAGEYRSPTGVMHRAGRGLEDTWEALMDKATGLRTRAIATLNDESVYLEHESTTLEVPPERGPDGGRAFFVTRWRTSEMLG